MTYLTEEEAAQKVCPTRFRQEKQYVGINLELVVVGESCIGHSCMAWRWAGGLPSTEKGYCGLAGRPGPEIAS